MTDAGLIKVLGTNEVVRYAGVSVLSSGLSSKNLRCRVKQDSTTANSAAYKSARQDAEELKTDVFKYLIDH